MIDWIVSHLGLTEASTVLDLAAGTGQLSRLMHGRVASIIAVEPVAAMRDMIQQDLPDVTVLDGQAEAIPLGNAAVDAVMVGEAFHWFETAPACGEIARVLSENGGLALLWNTPTWTVADTPWLKAFRQAIRRHRQAAGGYPAGGDSWQVPLRRCGHFETPEHRHAAHEQTLTAHDFLAQIASWSWIANLRDEQRRTLFHEVAVLLGEQEEIVIPYRTDLYLARRRV